jgi:hypothetical protein
MAQSQGVSKSTVNNIWRAHNLQPHRTVSGVNYFFALTTTISPDQRQLPFNS